jgi:type 1 glutamine amidotransferase
VAITRNLMLIGGHTHSFRHTAPMLADIFSADGIVTDVFDDIEAGLAELRNGRHRLLTVHCLRWTMSKGLKYALFRPVWGFSLSEQGRSAIREHLAAGRGMLGLHTASVSFDDWPEWGSLLGAVWIQGVSSHPVAGPLSISVDADDHPVTRGVEGFECKDERYTDLSIASGVRMLGSARTPDGAAPQPAVFVSEPLGGRSVYLTPGHEAVTFDIPAYRRLLRQSAAWCIGST